MTLFRRNGLKEAKVKLPSIVKLLAVVSIAALAPPVPARSTPAVPEPGETLNLTPKETRLTVPVMIDGRGPFPFLVDTGAERTVISRRLAEELGLKAGETATVHSMTEVSDIATFVIPTLQVGRNKAADIQAPALEPENIGAVGMLGTDTLRGQRVEFDFRRARMQVVPSGRRTFASPGTVIAVKGRNHLGRLLLSDAAVNGKKIVVIVDSGSQVTIGNNALRELLDRKGQFRDYKPAEVTSITGGRIRVDYGLVKTLYIGDLRMNDMPISFGDVHPFRQLQLTERPALLLGMDVLQLFDKVSVDMAVRRVKFTLGRRFKGMIGLQYIDPTGPRLLE